MQVYSACTHEARCSPVLMVTLRSRQLLLLRSLSCGDAVCVHRGKCPKLHLYLLALQDFLRNIPSKLLSADLYEKWMLALEKPSKEEKIEELRE